MLKNVVCFFNNNILVFISNMYNLLKSIKEVKKIHIKIIHFPQQQNSIFSYKIKS